MKRSTRFFLIAVGGAAIVVTSVLVFRQRGPSPSVRVGGWSGQAVLCGYREDRDVLSVLSTGDVLALTEEAEAVVETQCTVSSLGGRGRGQGRQPPALRADRTYFVLDTGRDRFDVRLVGVDLAGRQPSLEAEVTVPGEDCYTTADYRGQLMLLIEAPEGSVIPSVLLREVPLGC